ncbi:MAG: Sec-independent protein translocase protein TatB [Oligoflexales bacterium]
MFGVGPLELVVIVVAAIVFVGPKRLPEVMKQMGRFFVQARRYSNEVKSGFNEVVRQAEDELRQEELKKIRDELKEDVKAALPDKSEVFVPSFKKPQEKPPGDHGPDFFAGDNPEDVNSLNEKDSK